jgi:ubiquinone/menaquinone biosynthesis C-methylase UbiE
MLPAARSNENTALRFVAGDCLKLPFRDGSFDVVFGSLVLCQLPGLDQVVPEIRRLLVRGGVYVGIEPNPYNAVHVYRYLAGKCSPNLYLLRPRNLDAFRHAGFDLWWRFFYAKLPLLGGRLMGTCMGVLARLKV